MSEPKRKPTELEKQVVQVKTSILVPVNTLALTKSMDPPSTYSKVSPIAMPTVEQSTQKRKQGSVKGKSYKTTSPFQPAGSSHSNTFLVYSKKDFDDNASAHTSSSKKSRRTTAFKRQMKMDEGYNEHMADEVPNDLNMFKNPPSPPSSVCDSAVNRSNGGTTARIRPKFDICNWNGMSNTFRGFKAAVE